jgi:hypothetical protein
LSLTAISASKSSALHTKAVQNSVTPAIGPPQVLALVDSRWAHSSLLIIKEVFIVSCSLSDGRAVAFVNGAFRVWDTLQPQLSPTTIRTMDKQAERAEDDRLYDLGEGRLALTYGPVMTVWDTRTWRRVLRLQMGGGVLGDVGLGGARAVCLLPAHAEVVGLSDGWRGAAEAGDGEEGAAVHGPCAGEGRVMVGMIMVVMTVMVMMVKIMMVIMSMSMTMNTSMKIKSMIMAGDDCDACTL